MIFGVLPVRALIGGMILTACLFTYMLRVNMSINLIAMVQNTGSSDNNSKSASECTVINSKRDNSSELHEMLQASPDYGVRYDWDSNTQAMILGSFFWGYIVSSMPGGLLAEKLGPSRIILLTMTLSAILTIVTPLAASLHYSLVIIIRILLGLFGGVVYPALHCLISRWSPPVEKGKFIGALMGGTLGTVITWPMLGAVIENFGWSWAFFIPGIMTLLWCILWYFLVTDSPDVHPTISDSEKFFIIKSIGESNSLIKGIPPYKDIFSSIAFWALAILHFGSLWGLYLLLTSGPKFMSEVLGFNLGHSGLLAALPYMARMIFGFIFGIIGDYIRKTEKLTVTGIRKCFILFSHVIPGLFLIAQTLTGCNAIWAVTFLTLALGMNGAATVTNLQNSQDLSTKYAGSIYGIINCIGGTTGFLTPMVTGLITSKQNGLFEWHIIFWIGACVYIVCGLIFCFIGSGEEQPWHDKEEVPKMGIENQAYAADKEETQSTKV